MKNINFKKRKSSGFTLIELLLYISLSAAMLLIIFIFLSFLLQARVKGQVMAEVEQQGIEVMELIAQTTRNATKVNLPIQGNSGDSLNLTVVDQSKSPTIFELDNGVIRIIEGTSSPIFLTNSRIVISDLIFQNLSRANQPGNVRIQFTLTHVNPQNRNEYQYNKTFYSSANLRLLSAP